MDNRKWEANAAAAAPIPPATPSAGFPTKGNPVGAVPATKPGEWMWYALTEELRNVILEGGLTPNDTVTQVRDAIKNMIRGGDYKDSVRFTTTANIVLTGLVTQAGGDWPATLTAAERILVKNNALPAENGIYTAAAGAWVRATDADTGAEFNSGVIIPVESSATTLADTNWQLTTDGVIVIGTTALTFGNVAGITQVQADARYINIGYMNLRDEKATNTAGGSSVATAMPTGQTRALNTVARNTIAGASLATNQITLPAGTYRINATAPSTTNSHRAFLYNVTDAVVTILGTNENMHLTTDTDPLSSQSIVRGSFPIAATKVFELRHFTSEVSATIGLGALMNNAGYTEIYSQVEIIKES